MHGTELVREPAMLSRPGLKIAAPMVVLGLVLLGLGIVAAWNVHGQQKTSSELIGNEVRAMVVIEELHLEMREIRYQLNLFLRTRERRHLTQVSGARARADKLLQDAQSLARSGREEELIGVMTTGYQHFFGEFQRTVATLPPPAPAEPAGRDRIALPKETEASLTRMADELLTEDVLRPLNECLRENQQVVQRTNEAAAETAQHLKIGFLLLGFCGAVAGVLLGTGIVRGIGRSIVQLDVWVRSVAGKLSDVTDPVTFSHTVDLPSLERSLRRVEFDIAEVVERLQQRESEVLRNEQLARVGQLAAGLAHELRNPLMPMKMLVQAAIERGDEGGLSGRALHVLDDEISRMEQAIQSLLDFARPPLPEKSDVRVEEVVRQTVDLVAGRANRQGVRIGVRLPEKPVTARLDRSQIRQLLLNLLLNALDAQPGGGAIEIRAEVHSTAAREPAPDGRPMAAAIGDACGLTEHDALRLAAARSVAGPVPQVRSIEIRIADHGPGIPPELLASVFEPFFTTKETGTGLGLSVCRRIARDHDGSLTVTNLPHGGAEFTLLLPCSEQAA